MQHLVSESMLLVIAKINAGEVLFQNDVLLIVSQRQIKVFTLHDKTASPDPISTNFEMFLLSDKREQFLNTEQLQLLFSFVGPNFFEENLRDFFVKPLNSFMRQKDSFRQLECASQGSNQVLVFFLDELLQNNRQPCCWVRKLSDHRNNVRDDNWSVERVRQFA